MPIPTRILRAEARNLVPPPPLSSKQQERHERILKISKMLFARHGRQNITFSGLALALDMSATTLRRHFADLHALLGEILRLHLAALSNAIGEIPPTTPDLHTQRRAAYHAFTHTGLGSLTEAHLLLTREAHLLPDDERNPIEQTHQNLAFILAPDCPQEALTLLDSPGLTADRIETMLAALAPAAPARPAKPAPAKPILALPRPSPPATEIPVSKPGDWIFNAGIPLTARAPPAA